MSLLVEKYLKCDGKECTKGFYEYPRLSGDELRYWARRARWSHANGKDYCPSCGAVKPAGEG